MNMDIGACSLQAAVDDEELIRALSARVKELEDMLVAATVQCALCGGRDHASKDCPWRGAVPDGWRDAATVKPPKLEEVICKLESGLTRVGRWNANQGGYFQFAEFLHPERNGRNKYPPAESEANKVVQWHPISLYAAPAQPVPDGYKPVPILPDEDMFIAGMEADCLGRPSVDDETHVRSIWNAMLAAAPSPAAEGAKVARPAEVLSDELEPYDAGLFGDYGGGNVEWWHDYMRAELARAHDFYADQFARAIERAVLAQPSGCDELDSAFVARHLDIQYQRGFEAGWSAGVAGDEEKLAAAKRRVGRREEYEAAFPAALAQQQGRHVFRPPLTGRWHHGNGVIVSGTLRIARDDFEAGITEGVREEIFDWVCCTLNAAIAAERGE